MQSIKICTQANQPQGIFNQYLRPLAGMTLCLFAAGLLLFTAPLRAETEQVWEFDIPAGQLEPALVNYSTVSGVSLSYTPEVVEGLNQAGLKGAYTSDRALERLLAGTGLAYRLTAANTATVKPAEEEEPILMAPLTVEGVSESVRFWLSDLPEAYEGGQVARGGRMGLLGNQDVFDTPFSVSNYTAGLIENQQARTIDDLARNEPSVRVLNRSQQEGVGNLYIRGFGAGSIYDGLSGLHVPTSIPLEAMERVEIFKGPDALLNNYSVSLGGKYNIVPKRPLDTPLTRLTTSYDYRSSLGVHTDLSRRFGSEQQFGARLNVVSRGGESEIKGKKSELGTAALALDYRGERLKLETILDYYQLDLRGSGAFLLDKNAKAVPAAPNLSKYFPQPWEKIETNYTRALLRGEYKLNQDWTAHATFGTIQYEDYLRVLWGWPVDANGDFEPYHYIWKGKRKGVAWQGGIRGQFQTGGITHQLALEIAQSTMERYHDSSFRKFSAVKSNLYRPQLLASPDLAALDIKNLPKGDEFHNTSIAIADTLGFMDDRILLTAGLRRQNIGSKYFNRNGTTRSNYDKSAVTPSVGLVVKPWDKVSLYGNYIQALEQGPTAPKKGVVNAGEVLPPSVAEQVEFGVKLDLDGLGLTAGVFQIEKPSAYTNASNRFSLDGKQRNRGLELNVFGELQPNLRLLGGVTYVNAELTRTKGGEFNGKKAISTPALRAALNLEYDVPILPGLTLMANAEHLDSAFVRRDNSLKIPAYQLYGLGARYQHTIGDRQLTFRMNVDNLLDKDYWSNGTENWLRRGSPRRIILSFTVDF